jgi:hypothetical protein
LTNVFLRRVHNFALDVGWLPRPVVVKRRWLAIEFKDKRAVTSEEQRRQIPTRNNSPNNLLPFGVFLVFSPSLFTGAIAG